MLHCTHLSCFLKFHPGRRNQIEMTFLREGEYEILITDQMDI